MSATAFYIPSSSSSADITALQTQVTALKADVTSATDSNIPTALVKRDSLGNFASGTVSLNAVESNSGTLRVGRSADTINVGSSTDRAGAMTLYPTSLNLNSSITANVATLADLNLGMVYNGGNPTSNYSSSSGRIMMHATAHNTVQGRRNIPAGFQVRVLANGTSPSKSVLSFLGSETVYGNVIAECGSIDSDGVFKCSSVESRGTTLNIASQDNTSTLNLGSGTGVQTINMGNNGTGSTTINVGGGSDIVKVNLPLRDSANNPVFNTVLGAAGTFGDGSVFVGNIGVPQGKGNTYIGTQISSESSSTKFGEYNTGMGSMALNSIETGSLNNVAIGHRAFAGLRIGSDNVAIGTRAGHNIPNSSQRLMTGSNCTFIGTDARPAASDLVNATAIGSNALVDGSNTIQLGNTSVTDVKTSGTIRAAGLESIGTTLTIAGQNNTSVLNIGSGTGVQTINMGNTGAGTTAINIGGGTDLINFAGAGHTFTGAVQVTGGLLSVTGGITLPTAGGTAATLSHYEEYVHYTVFASATFTSSLGVLFARIGKVVTMTMPYTLNFTAESTTRLFNSVLVPERFRPFGKLFSHFEMVDNSVRVDGLVELDGGSITISPAHSTNFITGRAYTTYGFTMSWVLQ